MILLFARISLVSFILISCHDGCGERECSTHDRISQENDIDEFILLFMDKTKVPGVSIAVAKEGEVLFAKGYGFANVEDRIEMKPNIQLRTASVAKLLTATAIGKLVSEGKIDWDIPIGQYVDYLDEPYSLLTIRQLAGHTAGVVHRPPRDQIDNRQYDEIRAMVGLFQKTPLRFKPGSDYEYSTSGFSLLAAIIEGVTEKSYAQYMTEEVFMSLEMHQTFPENIDKLRENDAKLYYFDKDKLHLDDHLVNGSYKLPGAGFRSTPTDLVKLMMAYENGFLDPEVIRVMFTGGQTEKGEDTRVGIGWRTSFDPFGNKVVEHAGNWQGARTVLTYFPEEQVSIAIMINAQCQVFIQETAHILAQIFRESQQFPSELISIESPVNVVNNRSDGTVEKYMGKIEFEHGGKGRLSVETKIDWLKDVPIRYLGFANHYAAFTSHGLFYLNIDKEPLKGRLYMYQDRNKANPTEASATISINEK